MPIPKKTCPINRSFMRDEVYNTLLKWIMEGVLRPGEKLLDKELAKRLGVSRTPVREALKRLEDKNLIEASANRWTKVAEINMDETELIYPIIFTLEPLAISLAMPTMASDDIKNMENANRELALAIKSSDPVKASSADTAFHEIFILKSGNKYLIDILRDLKIKHRRLEVIYFGGCACALDSVYEHEKIIEAIKIRDEKLAGELIKLNWINSLKRQKEQIKKKAG